MRQFITAAAMALGLIALWAAILPLTAEPAPKAASPGLSKAMFLCRGANGIDSACVAALGKALVIDARADKVTQVSDRYCKADPHLLADLRG